MSTRTLRIIHDGPLPGPENMARDEALLHLVGKGESPPTLRFYQWDPPTISLGYFQKYADYEALPPPAGDLAVVRRLTGGGAILHDKELTYSIIVPHDHVLLKGGPNKLYERAHDALIETLAEHNITANRCGTSDNSGAAKGPFFCFARRHCLDVLVGSEKLAGSAQRRTKEAVLQHGSIILEHRYKQQPAASVAIDANNLATDISERITKQHNLDVSTGGWSEAERIDATGYIPKYEGKEWTRRV